ncbi:amidohydrolase [Leucobacter chromiiresistens]|uniref:Amidohydrolase n=1 Tax=Leucobacter chromiiresistens TaxID=1079994 RepID=A0A147EMI9_9MICO|nr:amidohydrolase [Leucobacter chromiiresistens]KTR85625.1 amidohydrolase [Leucobacter chromiiresistens]
MTHTPTADTVFEHGWIYTGAESSPVFGGIAVADGRILSTDAEEVARLAQTATTRVDLAGRLLVAGFQDAHAHPVMAGIELLSCDLSGCDTAEETLAAVAAYASAHPDLAWIQGAGWSMDAFPGGTPTRQMLDEIVPDRPVLLENRDHHGAWANTRAFALAGITADTPDPADGRFEREADGTPAGTAHEGAMSLFGDVRPRPTLDQAYAGLLAAQQHLISYGITAWQDAAVGEFMGSPDTVPVYLRAARDGALKVRVRGAQWWNREDGDAQLGPILARRDEVARQCDPDRLSLASVKVMVDGVAENFTAAMHECYRDHHGDATDNRGISFFDPRDMARFVAALDAAGMQVHFHALGDRAVTDALDAVEYARERNGASGNRHHLAHLQVVRSEDVARFAPLEATANIQALWACHEDQLDTLTLPFLADDAEDHHYPFGELVASGARLAAGSDWSVSSPDPVQAIHIAVNRRSPHSDLPPLGPESQRLTLAQALDAYTQGTARVNHLDHATGRIEPGYYADLAILDRNLFELAPEDLHTARVDETWIGGERVYARAEDAA